MRAKQIPSSDSFVVKLASGSSPEERASLASFGTVEEVAGFDLLLLRLHAAADPKSIWTRILDQASSVEWAAPVFLDDRNQPHLPTGDMTVRFDHMPSDAEMQRFTAAHGLRLRGRNEFISEQLSFTPVQSRRMYLPELLQSLAMAEGVAAAWANTLSQYRRLEEDR